MMLRNMFDMVATEGTLRQLLRQLTFAKDLQDRLRVTVDNTVAIGTVNNAVVNNAASTTVMQGAGLNPAHWGANSWNTVDARYQYGEQQMFTFIQNRERWTFS